MEVIAEDIMALDDAEFPKLWRNLTDAQRSAVPGGHQRYERLAGPIGRTAATLPGNKTSSLPATLALPYAGLRVRGFDEMEVERHPQYVVKGLLSVGALAVAYGKSGAGKTFWTGYLGYCVAADQPFFGRRVSRGLVVYLAAEAASSLERRWAAWRQQYGIHDIPLVAIENTLDLLNDDDVARVLECVRQIAATCAEPLRLLVIDTVAATMPGANENQSDTMTKYVANLARLRDELSTAVIAIHHSGKDEQKGARGHSSLRAAVDTEFEVAVRDGDIRVATLTKSRDGETGIELGFRLKSVVVGIDNDGDTITTCLVEPSEAPPRDKTSARVNAEEARQFAVLEALCRAGAGFSAKRAEWFRACEAAGLSISDDTFDRRTRRLERAGLVRKVGRAVYRPAEAEC